MFSVGTKDGFKIFDARNGRLCYEKSEIFLRRPLLDFVEISNTVVRNNKIGTMLLREYTGYK
jgi:hypothetical protein